MSVATTEPFDPVTIARQILFECEHNFTRAANLIRRRVKGVMRQAAVLNELFAMAQNN